MSSKKPVFSRFSKDKLNNLQNLNKKESIKNSIECDFVTDNSNEIYNILKEKENINIIKSECQDETHKFCKNLNLNENDAFDEIHIDFNQSQISCCKNLNWKCFIF